LENYERSLNLLSIDKLNDFITNDDKNKILNYIKKRINEVKLI
jgi:archaellum biogenesis ATPase FlaH